MTSWSICILIVRLKSPGQLGSLPDHFSRSGDVIHPLAASVGLGTRLADEHVSESYIRQWKTF